MELAGSAPQEDDEEAAEDWLCREPAAGRRALPGTQLLPRKAVPTRNAALRVIAHIDMDCFYAQVEMIRNPDLKDKPLGVQQKYLVVTCNYTARSHGVKKMMSVKDAKEICPQLVLVSGEDLIHYREMSYKVTELLEEFCPLVERLGFDENFIDLTEMVEKRLEQQQSGYPQVVVSGHIYNNQTMNQSDQMHVRIALGSQIAAEMRAALCDRLGLTGCAGVASNKLLSKLVGGAFKPNQQTVLLPESCQHLLDSLDHIKKVPGIGYKTTKRLELLGIRSLRDLQTFPLAKLEKELGVAIAQRIQMLSCGEDDSPVTPTGPPQSLSDEDSFKKCSTEAEVKTKIEELLGSLLDRICKDGRKPHTIRLTIRQFSPTNKWFNRESRQCPVPSHIIPKLGAGNCDVMNPLVDLLMKLFKKMINVKMPFHLTLLNVCFSNLKSLSKSTKGSIGFYLTQKTSSTPRTGNIIEKMEAVDIECPLHHYYSGSFILPRERTVPSSNTTEGQLNITSAIEEKDIQAFPHLSLPDGVDQEVFSHLPEDIKKEILSSTGGGGACTRSMPSHPSPSSSGVLTFFARQKVAHRDKCQMTPTNTTVTSISAKPYSTKVSSPENYHKSHERAVEGDHTGKEEIESQPFLSSYKSPAHPPSDFQKNICFQKTQASGNPVTFMDTTCDVEALLECREPGKMGITFPSGIDPKIFSELPLVVQKELMAEWRQQSPVSKIHASKHHKRVTPKGKKKTAVRSPQPNSLLKYFKPN